MTPKQAVEIYKGEKFYRSEIIGMTESDNFFHLYDKESCKGLCIPFAVVEKKTKKCVKFSDITDEDVELGYFQMKVVPKDKYI